MAGSETYLGVYRRGDLVVVRKGGRLPPFCVKCGEPGFEEPINQKVCMYSLPARVGISVGFSVMMLFSKVFLIWFLGFVSVVTSVSSRRSAQLTVWFCEKHREEHELARLLGPILTYGGTLVWVVLLAVKAPAVLTLAALALVLFGMLLGVLSSRLRAISVESGFTVVKGAREPFLSHLRVED